ncbi:MAG: hypothetical protein HYZ13_02710 [Acidobacteria bacterium]|nr:hypothetical protein [Acidobacteriota bacterium]
MFIGTFALGVIFYTLGAGDGSKRIAAAIATALFAWIATCELEVFKAELSHTERQTQWRRETLAKADSCLFDFKVVLEEVATSLGIKPAGESDAQWDARAGTYWARSVETMDNIRREIWGIRTELENHEVLDSSIQNVSREIRGLILIHQDLMANRGGNRIADLISQQKALNDQMKQLDERFQNEITKITRGK